MSPIRLLARPMLASVFIADGFDAAVHPDAHVEKFRKVEPVLERAGVPPVLTSDARLLTRVLGGVSAVAGLMLATGRRPRSAALTLAVINIPLTIVNNPAWTSSGEQRKEQVRGLLRGAGLAGGLLLAAADLAGRPSMSWRLSNAVDHRAELRSTRSAAKERYKERYKD